MCCSCLKFPVKRTRSHTCRDLILLWTFSWDETLTGSGSERTWSSRKMLSWEIAREPIVPWELLVTENRRLRGNKDVKSDVLFAKLFCQLCTHAKFSSEPSPFPAVISLADWLSLASASAPFFLALLKKRLFRDLILELLRSVRAKKEADSGWFTQRQNKFYHISKIFWFCLFFFFF